MYQLRKMIDYADTIAALLPTARTAALEPRVAAALERMDLKKLMSTV
jgi:hypothetical protein